MKSEKNSFDSKYQNMTLTGIIYEFNGEYENIKDNKILFINIYTTSDDILTIYHTDDPTDISSPIINLIDTYNISSNINKTSTFLINLKSRFVKIKIESEIDNSAKRIYDVFLLDNLNISIKNEKNIWNNNTIVNNNTSDSINLTNNILNNLSFYGNAIQSDPSGSTLDLIVQFSNDNINFYDSQYVYSLGYNNNFGFNLNTSVKYIRLKADLKNDITQSYIITTFVNY